MIQAEYTSKLYAITDNGFRSEPQIPVTETYFLLTGAVLKASTSPSASSGLTLASNI